MNWTAVAHLRILTQTLDLGSLLAFPRSHNKVERVWWPGHGLGSLHHKFIVGQYTQLYATD